MEHSVFYHFYKNAGFNVYTSHSSEWCEIQRGMLISIPYHHLIVPSLEELDDLLKRSGAWGLRFPTGMDYYGFLSKLEICQQFGYSLQSLKPKIRNQVRKGEKYCEIRPVSMNELKNEGLDLNLQTIRRQGRNDPKADRTYWHRICEALGHTNGVNVIGSYFQGRLAAYMVVLETCSMAEIIMHNSETALLQYCPNNLLTYYATRLYLTERKNPLPVCYGLGSLEDNPALDHYKMGMGYIMQPIKQQLYFRKKVRFFLRPSILSIGKMLNHSILGGKSYTWDKCYAMLQRHFQQQ